MGTKQREISTEKHLQACRYYYYHAISTEKKQTLLKEDLYSMPKLLPSLITQVLKFFVYGIQCCN
jgi:hypothetical protein